MTLKSDQLDLGLSIICGPFMRFKHIFLLVNKFEILYHFMQEYRGLSHNFKFFGC